jgi:hypothetical protein
VREVFARNNLLIRGEKSELSDYRNDAGENHERNEFFGEL